MWRDGYKYQQVESIIKSAHSIPFKSNTPEVEGKKREKRPNMKNKLIQFICDISMLFFQTVVGALCCSETALIPLIA